MTGQFTNWITGRRPSVYDADRNGKVLIKTGSTACQLEHWGCVLSSQQWSHTSHWQEGYRLNGQALSGWINDRLPEMHDSDDDGDVELPDPDGQGELCVHWADVVPGQTWRHCFGANQSQQATNERTFVSVVPYPHPGDYTLLAVANDGTVWELSRFGPVWRQIPALPQG